MNKIRTLKVSKIQPELFQKELILFNYGLNGKKEEGVDEKTRNEGDKEKQEIEAEEAEVSKNENGEEIKTIKKVKKNLSTKVIIKKPTRALFDEAELFYGVKLSEGIKHGLLTRPLLAKRINNDGGIFSDEEQIE